MDVGVQGSTMFGTRWGGINRSFALCTMKAEVREFIMAPLIIQESTVSKCKSQVHIQ